MPTISINAPRFASREFGGSGYVTADTLTITIDGQTLPIRSFPRAYRETADLINAGKANHASIHALLDPYADKLLKPLEHSAHVIYLTQRGEYCEDTITFRHVSTSLKTLFTLANDAAAEHLRNVANLAAFNVTSIDGYVL